MIVGTLGGGVAADRYGLRPTLVGALLVTGVGVAGMIGHGPLWWLVLAAALAQAGTGSFPTLARLVLFGLVPVEEQREALAWQRATANLGLVGVYVVDHEVPSLERWVSRSRDSYRNGPPSAPGRAGSTCPRKKTPSFS
jgi:predicted MFS family arabinose efflux permease